MALLVAFLLVLLLTLLFTFLLVLLFTLLSDVLWPDRNVERVALDRDCR